MGADARASEAIRHDFDRIARALEAAEVDDALQPAERALMDLVPPRCERVLEVGCGHGVITRHVARRSGSVLAIDLSPEMIRVARARSAAHANIDYRVADVTTFPLEAASFDLVLSVATLHHLPLAPTIARLAQAVRPGGLLLVQDIVSRPGVRGVPANALATIARALRRARGERRLPRDVEALYREHGRDERYLTPAEASRTWTTLLPGTRVRQHLEWRYTAAWRRDGA